MLGSVMYTFLALAESQAGDYSCCKASQYECSVLQKAGVAVGNRSDTCTIPVILRDTGMLVWSRLMGSFELMQRSSSQRAKRRVEDSGSSPDSRRQGRWWARQIGIVEEREFLFRVMITGDVL